MLCTSSILNRMRIVDGWLDDAEAELLITTTAKVARLANDGQTTAIVEVGSYCGKSTIVFGLTLKGLERSTARIYAIDPHEGEVTTLGQTITQWPPTFEKFIRNLQEAGVADVVETIRARSYEVVWDKPIALLFIDGLHDYTNVGRDFNHFAPWVETEGRIAFHDYGGHFFGVKKFVDELIVQGGYRMVEQAHSLVVLEKKAVSA